MAVSVATGTTGSLSIIAPMIHIALCWFTVYTASTDLWHQTEVDTGRIQALLHHVLYPSIPHLLPPVSGTATEFRPPRCTVWPERQRHNNSRFCSLLTRATTILSIRRTLVSVDSGRQGTRLPQLHLSGCLQHSTMHPV